MIMTKWTDYLTDIVLIRLADCRSTKADLKPLVEARWKWMQDRHKDEQGFTKEDALIYILELLDDNSRFFDLTQDEYNELIA